MLGAETVEAKHDEKLSWLPKRRFELGKYCQAISVKKLNMNTTKQKQKKKPTAETKVFHQNRIG